MGKKFSIPSIPLYLSVKKVLLEAIHAGDLGINGKLPSEEMLAKQFNVSRATIRSTLQSLEKDGVVSRIHGVGTFLNSETLQVKMHIDEAKGFFQLIKDSGRKPSIYETKVTMVDIDKRLSKLLGIPRTEKAMLLERLFLGDGEPVIYVLEYIPTSSLIQIPPIEEIPQSIYEFSEVFCHEPIDYSISEIIPVKADSTLKKKMMLDKYEMFLKLEELHYGKQNRPLIFSDVYVRDSMIRFKVLRRMHHF